MRRFSPLLTLSLLVILLSALLAPARAQVDDPPPPNPDEQLAELLDAGARARREEAPVFLFFEPQINRIIYSKDGKTALIWLALADRETGEIIESEPGLVVAQQISGILANDPPTWDLTFQSDKDWVQTFSRIPAGLLTTEQSQTYLAPPGPQAAVQTIGGYKLPWAYGQSRRLSQSIGHVLLYANCSTCFYAFDFADGTNFPLLAARGGVVSRVSRSCPNNDHSCVNYLVLEDSSTSPTTYQLYLHLAYNSIPADLTVGTPVSQGQYIGNVDNTGASTGSHLHFHVHTNPYSYWGTAVDITFLDVDINGGRPRTCQEADLYPEYGSQCHEGGNWFTSGNSGANPPTGDLLLPARGEILNTPQLTLGGVAADNVGVSRVDVLARWDGQWHVIGQAGLASPNASSTSFLATLDLCAAGAPQGPLDVSVRIWDIEGNIAAGYPGLRGVLNNNTCAGSAPAGCQPTADQVALFSEPNYQGACQVFDAGTYYYYQLGNLANNDAASARVGANVRAVLYDVQLGGRPDALEWNDANLSDNRMGNANMVSSLIVEARTKRPDGATFYDVLGSDGSTTVTSADSLVLSWWRGSATHYSATLSGPVNLSINNTPVNSWSVGSLLPGDYTLAVTAVNSGGASYTASKGFTVSAASLPDSPPQTAALDYSFEAGPADWATSGLWRWTTDPADANAHYMAYYDPDIYRYYRLDEPTDNAPELEFLRGDLTSPPITIPDDGQTYYLRFQSYAETESPYPFWDQRLVQVRVEDVPGTRFTDTYQVWADPQKIWVDSPALDLSPYAGHTIRVRFHMDVVEYRYNDGQGWLVDNITINTTPPPDCGETDPDDTWQTAHPLPPSGQVSGLICPAGDVDVIRFEGTAGQRVSLNVDAWGLGAQFDPYLYLLDASGRLLVEQDDEIPGQLLDPLVNYTLPETGSYYVKLKAWNHPGEGDPGNVYHLQLLLDNAPPSVSLTYPGPDGSASADPFFATAQASDDAAIAYVAFYYHNPDWGNYDWQLIGMDSNGSDGYRVWVNPAALGPLDESAIYVEASDFAGNTRGDLRFITSLVSNMPPESALTALPPTQETTAIHLTWTASDVNNDLAAFDLERSLNGGAWLAYQTDLPATVRQAWAEAAFGQTVAFRLRARDYAGNVEAWDAGVSTTIAAACSPDAYEPNDAAATATPLPLQTTQAHNLCGPGNADWVSLTVTDPGYLLVRADSTGGGAAVRLSLYAAANPTVPLLTANSSGYGAGAALGRPIEPGNYLVKILPLTDGLAGNAATYNLYAFVGQALYLPVIAR